MHFLSLYSENILYLEDKKIKRTNPNIKAIINQSSNFRMIILHNQGL